MLKVYWGEKPEEVAVPTVEELDRLLDQLQRKHRRKPVLVEVELPSSGDALSIGLGRTESVMNFVSSSGDPPYWSSVGDHEEDDEFVDFDYMGSYSEFPRRFLIPLALAREAMRDFVRTGKLSKKVKWEEV